MKALLDRYVAAKKPKSEDDLRYHWRRLVERVGDIAVEAVTPDALESFLIDLRRFPKTRRPDITKLGFDGILEKYGDVAPPISEPTVWKHFVSYGQVFSYALTMRLIAFNPVAAVMPSKPKPTKEVRAYTPEEIAALFAKPMFTGCSKTHNGKGDLHGYRDVPGAIVLKDGRYWMPILNLFHGNRMEEWGGAKVADIKREDEIDYLDLTQRTLKNGTANRLLPIHPKLIEIGFLDHVAERRAAGDVYLFPEFPHDTSEADDPEASTRQFTKWWGLWSDANGFPDPTVNFHAFRHTFKRACRGKVTEEISDLITGHKGVGGAGRSYGKGVDLTVLAEAIKLVEFPTFKLTGSRR
jgi:integrase